MTGMIGTPAASDRVRAGYRGDRDGYRSDMQRPDRPLKLVVIDDHQMVLDGLTAMLRP
jgi:hypothetical protein